ncbi:MAG: hypothetical protein QXK37_05260, partial [Candidatus Woesearchaeota archaeon]
MVAKYYYVLIGLIALLSALFIIISRLRRLLLKYISTFLIVIIIGINAGFCIAATLTGMGIYKRSTDISVIGEYIYKNLGNEPFSCVAGIHARTLTFYTGKPCLWWLLVNETWLEEHKEEVKYFVVEINLDAGGTGGLGKFTPTGELDLSNNNTREWGRNYPNKYRWLILNTVDITAETGLPSNNQNFRVYRLK